MASCSEKCFLYDAEFDGFRISWNDTGPDGAHFCDMYDDRIPDGIFDGPKECPFFMDKEKFGEG